MNPEIRTRISRFLFMSKLSKQDKIDVYNNWKNSLLIKHAIGEDVTKQLLTIFFIFANPIINHAPTRQS